MHRLQTRQRVLEDPPRPIFRIGGSVLPPLSPPTPQAADPSDEVTTSCRESRIPNQGSEIDTVNEPASIGNNRISRKGDSDG